jgi:hypothetical protein
MKFSVLILPETSCIDVVINVFKQVMGYEMASLLYKDYGLPVLDLTLNSLNA